MPFVTKQGKGEGKIERDANIPFVCTWSKTTFTIITTNLTTQLVLSTMSLVDQLCKTLDYIYQINLINHFSIS